MARKVVKMSELKKLEYIHFALQEAQTYHEGLEGFLDPELEKAIELVEDLREQCYENS